MAKCLYEEENIRAIAEKIRSLTPSLPLIRTITTEQMPEGIQCVYEEGKSAGKTEGYQNGYSKGYTEGYSDGKTRGHNEGYNDGYGEGVGVGIDRGETIGYTNGYKDGAEQALNSIPRAEGVGF